MLDYEHTHSPHSAVSRAASSPSSILRQQQGDQRKVRAKVEAHKQVVRDHQLNVQRLVQKIEQEKNLISTMAQDIDFLNLKLEEIPDNKKVQLLRQYNQMTLEHQEKTRMQAALQTELRAAEQAYFTASVELSKLAPLEKQLLEDELATIHEQKILSQYKKELEISKIRKVETSILTRHQEQVERERISEESTLRVMEDSRRARSLAQERLRVRLEVSKTTAEQVQKRKEEDAQKRIQALLSLKQNYDNALAELKSDNERKSQRLQKRNDARLQETVTLLSQGLNPYEIFRQREMETQKQKERLRITNMQAKRKNDVRLLMLEDVHQYNVTLKKVRQDRDQQSLMQSRPTRPRPMATTTLSATESMRTTGDKNKNNLKRTANSQEGEHCYPTDPHVLQDIPEPTSRPKKVFSLNLPGAHSLDIQKTGGESYNLQSALSCGSLVSSASPYSARSSLNHSAAGGEGKVGGGGGDFDTTRSLAGIAHNYSQVFRTGNGSGTGDGHCSGTGDGHRPGTGDGHRSDFKSSRKTQAPQKALSILEQKMMERTMQSLKNNIVKKQVVMNKEFEGKSFITKPNILRFNDFEVGSSYTKKITVTNVSLSFNTFKVLDLPVRVSDFFKISYAPPGRLSAGTGVPIDVTFTPALSTPIFEKLVILAETGQFEIPIECVPKQCKVSLSTSHIEFDNIALGETQVRTLKLSNNGGLASTVEVSFSSESCSIDSDLEVHTDPDGKKWPITDTVQSAFVFSASTALQAYSTQSFEITFTPPVLGAYSAVILFHYKGPDNMPAVSKLLATATVTDVPVYLSSREIDFRVCYCGQLYRECVILHNRGKIALKASVKVPNILKKYFEVVPRVAFVQAHSSLSVQLKFKPTIELLGSSMRDVLVDESPNNPPALDVVGEESDESSFSGANKTSLGHDGMKLDPSRTICLPVMISVASLPSPIWFLFKALVTNAMLTVRPDAFDFGECSINESVNMTFHVSNHSVTPIRYGFMHLPKEIQISPGDGFGTLLPLEEMCMVATFSPLTATQHSFHLTIKTDQEPSSSDKSNNSLLDIPCCGTGIKPPLQFSPAIITIPPTSIGDMNTASVFLENISKVTQIFEICVPDHCPFLLITPTVSVLAAGTRAHIKIDFEPNQLRYEKPVEFLPHDQHPPAPVVETTDPAKSIGEKSLKPRSYSRKSSSRSLASPKSSATLNPTNSHPNHPFPDHQSHKSERRGRKEKDPDPDPDPDPVLKTEVDKTDFSTIDSTMLTPTTTLNLVEAKLVSDGANLLNQKNTGQPLPVGQVLTWKIPCFSMCVNKQQPVATAATGGTCKDVQVDKQGTNSGAGAQQQQQQVVYLEISATVAPPTLARVLEPFERSNSMPPSSPLAPNPPVDFGQVPIGQSVVKKITIRNNSPNEIKPQLAAVYGNMTVLNAVRPMLPKQSQVLQIQYKPDSHGMHLETIELTVGKHHRLIVPVQGQGVSPKLTIDPMPEDHCLDLGYTIIKDSSKKEIKLVNASQFAVGYHINLLRTGPKNLNGINPFSVVPDEGDVPVGGEKVITIAFEPDHENHFFHDELQIEVKGESTKRTIYLKGGCTGTRALYLLGNLISVEASQHKTLNMGLNDIIKPGYSGCIPRGSYTLNFTPSLATFSGPIVRSLVFGNAKVKRERGIIGEVIFEPLSPQAIKDGFSIEGGLRYVIEPDSTRTIDFRFDPSVHSECITSKNTKEPNRHFNTIASILQGTVETSFKCILRGGYSAPDKEASFTLILVGHYIGT